MRYLAEEYAPRFEKPEPRRINRRERKRGLVDLYAVYSR